MASITYNDVQLIIRNDTTENWGSSGRVLLKGELGIEKRTNGTYMMKVGDGVNTWGNLKYIGSPVEVNTSNPTGTDSSYDIGTMWINTTTDKAFIIYDNTPSAAIWKQVVDIDELKELSKDNMLISKFATNAKVSDGYVDKAIMADSATKADTATKLSTGRTISITGDAAGSSATLFDGSADATINIVLKASGVKEGTYTKLTVDSKGIVTAAENISATDIPDITLSKITDAGTAASKDVGESEGNVPVLGANGKLSENILPALAITEVFEADGESAMLGLNAQVGDVCVRSDVNKSFILKQTPATELKNWVELKTPTNGVISVNGQTGVVTLTTTNIEEGTNLYYTEERFASSFATNIAKTASTALSDSNTLVRTTDTLTLNCGNV